MVPEKYETIPSKWEGGDKLEKQFDNPELFGFDVPEAGIEIHDVATEHLKDNVPAIVIPGWSGNPRAYKQTVVGLASHERRVLSVNAPHGVETSMDVKHPEHPLAELRKTEAILKTLEKKDIKRADIVAHSEGAIVAALAAALHPEKFRSLVLVAPGGFMEGDNLESLIKRFLADAVSQLKNQKSYKTETEREKNDKEKNYKASPQGKGRHDPGLLTAIKVIGSSPVLSFKEVKAIAETNILKLLNKARGAGVKIAVISSIDDQTFPLKKMHEAINPEPGKILGVDGVYTARGTHNEFFLWPGMYAKLVDQALTDLNQKK